MLSVPHLDREFDYLVSAEQSDDAQPGVRVRVRFHGRLVDAFVLERRSDTDHVGKLGWLDRVVSAEPVLTPDVRRLVDAVAARYAGTRADVLRLAIPPRHASVEKQPRRRARADRRRTVGHRGVGPIRQRVNSFSPRLRDGRAARAVWQALPGEQWADRLAEAAAVAVDSGRGVLAVVPDQRDVDALCAGQHSARRRRPRWWRCRRDSARHSGTGAGCRRCAATRAWSSAPAARCSRPVADLGLVLVWDDGDDTLAEPRAPYPHAREVAMLRAHQLRCAAVIGGYARTAEAQALGAQPVGARPGGRPAGGAVRGAAGDRARGQRIRPGARSGGTHAPGCRRWRCAPRERRWTPAIPCWSRCRAGVTCPRWPAGAVAPSPAAGTAPARCRCPDRRRRGRGVPVVRARGTSRTALRPLRLRRGPRRRRRRPPHRRGARPSVSRHHRRHVRRRRRGGRVPGGPALVVATPGAEPVATGGYGAALLLDGWALLGRQDLRAAEDTLRRWMAATTLVRSRGDGGVVAVVAESTMPTVQALIRWDPVGHAEAELDARAEVGLPPARPHRGGRRRTRGGGRTARHRRPAGRRRAARTRRPAARRPPTPWHARRRCRSPACWFGCPGRVALTWRPRCGGPPACSARAMIRSRFACKSTRLHIG